MIEEIIKHTYFKDRVVNPQATMTEATRKIYYLIDTLGEALLVESYLKNVKGVKYEIWS